MDEQEILTNIKSRLDAMGYDYESLSTSQKKHLSKIESEIAQRLSAQQLALDSLKNNKINIASISSAISITRKTIYNNDVLKEYIEYANKLYEDNCPTNDVSNLKEQLIEYKDVIDKMVHRDVVIENLKYEIESLQQEVAMYREQVEDLMQDNAQLINQVRSYENKKKVKSALNIIR